MDAYNTHKIDWWAAFLMSEALDPHGNVEIDHSPVEVTDVGEIIAERWYRDE